MNTNENINETFFDDDQALPPEAFTDIEEEGDDSVEIDDDREHDFRGSIDDMSDDADALASAGHGMEEDYNGGCFNDME